MATDLAAQLRRLKDAACDAYSEYAEAHELSLPGGDGTDPEPAGRAYRAAEDRLRAFQDAHPTVT
jgi:hypothetical protein